MDKAPRHPEVNQENTTRLEPNNQILASPLDRGDRLPLELCRDLAGIVGTRESRVRDLDSLERAADEVRLESGADRLDLGQLGHDWSVASRPGP
jgi:hypothetical protein